MPLKRKRYLCGKADAISSCATNRNAQSDMQARPWRRATQEANCDELASHGPWGGRAYRGLVAPCDIVEGGKGNMQ